MAEQNLTVETLLKDLHRELPPIWERPRTTDLTGGAVNARTLANLMSLGEGPDGTYKMGRKVIITKEPFLNWLRPRIQVNCQNAAYPSRHRPSYSPGGDRPDQKRRSDLS